MCKNLFVFSTANLLQHMDVCGTQNKLVTNTFQLTSGCVSIGQASNFDWHLLAWQAVILKMLLVYTKITH